MPPPRLTPIIDLTAAAAIAALGFVLAYRAETRRPRIKARTFVPAPRSPADEPLVLQQTRASEHGRGRHALGPLEIPWIGWKDILIRTYEGILNHRVMTLAAGVGFYSLLALFPAVTAGVSLYGLFADAKTIADHLTLLSDMVPTDALSMIGDQIARITASGGGKLTLGFGFGLALALWSANAAMKALFDALNIIYDEIEKRSFVWLNVESLLFTLCAIVLMLVVVGGVVVTPLLLARFGVASASEALLAFARWPGMFLIALIGISVLYRYGPSRNTARWRWVSVGSLLSAILWIVVSSAFSYYLAHFGNYDATYGSLGAVAGMMMWMWLSALVVLAGAELNSEIEHQTARDSTVGKQKPLGTRGAVMADTVGAARA